MWLGGCIQQFLPSVLRSIFGNSIAFQKEYLLLPVSRIVVIFIFILSSGLISISSGQQPLTGTQNTPQTMTREPHDVAIALGTLPFSINTMKTEAVVLTENLVTNTPNQQIIGRSAFADPDLFAKTNSTDLLRQVIQPPQRQDFNLHGAVAYVESSRSHVEQNFGIWEAPNFYEVDKLIFDQSGYLIAQRSYYYPEEQPRSLLNKGTGGLNRLWWPGKNRNTKRLEAEAEAEAKALEQGKGRKIEGCYALDIDFVAEGFDCFDAEKRILYVTEWSPKGIEVKKDSYQLHADGPWVSVHIEESFVAPTYRTEKHYDFRGNLIEFKHTGNNANQHLLFFYNESGQRVTEAVLDSNAQATACKFMIYGYFDTLENVRYYSVKQNELNKANDDESQTAFSSSLTQQNYVCEKEIPSVLEPTKSTVMTYGWLYDDQNVLAGRRKQEISHYDGQGALLERTIFDYLADAPTTLAEINKYNSSGQSTASITFDYDKQGRLVKEERFQFDGGETGRLLEQSNYIYKAKESTLLEKTTEDYELSRSKSIKQFDEAGNVIREQRYELFNRMNVLNNIFRLKSDVSRNYTGRSFVNEVKLEEGNNAKHESYTYVFDYAQDGSGEISNWIQKDEGSYVNKFDDEYAEPHHTNARLICYYPDSLAMSPNLICTSPFEP